MLLSPIPTFGSNWNSQFPLQLQNLRDPKKIFQFRVEKAINLTCLGVVTPAALVDFPKSCSKAKFKAGTGVVRMREHHYNFEPIVKCSSLAWKIIYEANLEIGFKSKYFWAAKLKSMTQYLSMTRWKHEEWVMLLWRLIKTSFMIRQHPSQKADYNLPMMSLLRFH